MHKLRGKEGAALVTALLLTMLSLVIAMALLYTVTMGSKISAGQKRYRSALAAAHGGVELLTMEIFPALFLPSATQDKVQGNFAPISMQLPQYGCLQQKLNNPTAQWSADCDASADPAQSPDVTFMLSGQPGEQGFSVSAKIVDTALGNTDNVSDSLLDVGLSAAGKDEVIHPQHVPGLYNLAVQGGRAEGASREKARLSVLYAY